MLARLFPPLRRGLLYCSTAQLPCLWLLHLPPIWSGRGSGPNASQGSVGPQRPRPPTRPPTRDLPPSLFQRRPASSINQAIRQAIKQSSDREPAPPPVLFCSLLAAPHHPSCHRDAASAPRRSRLQKQLLMPLLIECHHRDRGARYLRMSPWPPSHVVLRPPRHGVPSQCVLQ